MKSNYHEKNDQETSKGYYVYQRVIILIYFPYVAHKLILLYYKKASRLHLNTILLFYFNLTNFAICECLKLKYFNFVLKIKLCQIFIHTYLIIINWYCFHQIILVVCQFTKQGDFTSERKNDKCAVILIITSSILLLQGFISL